MATTTLLTLYLLSLAAAVAPAQHAPSPAARHEHPDHMNRRFDPETSAAAFDNPRRDEWQKPAQVIEALGLKPGMMVADIGAGTGYFTVRLAREAAAPLVYAADIEPKMVDYIRKRAENEGLKNIVPVLAAEDSPNLPEAVDLALMVNTYHHVPRRVEYFRALQKSLAPDGRVAIIDWKPGAPSGPPKEFRFTAQQIQKEMADAGYRVLAEHDFLPHQTFLVFGPMPPVNEAAGKVWDEVYRRPDAPFRTGPTPVLPGAIAGLLPGKALDFGMGLGRNAIFLAERGWEVTGVDLSEEALRQVTAVARERGLPIQCVQADLRQWDLGREKWDLIVAANMHTVLVESAERIIAALKPGGLLVAEGFHEDVKDAVNFKPIVRVPPGHPSNQLLKLFGSLRVLRYEDSLAVADRQKGLPPTYSRVQLVAYKE